MSKAIDKILITVTQTMTMDIEISEATGYDMPDSIMEAHKMLNSIQWNPEEYVCLNDKEYARVETKLEDITIKESK